MAPKGRNIDAKALTALAGLVANAIGEGGGEGVWGQVKRRGREAVTRDPIDATGGTVLVATYLFWQAERRVNPKVKTFGDALVFVSTCLSVGYSDIFARTEKGKVIASWLMTVGPSMAASLFDAPAAETTEAERSRDDTQRQILAKLDAILVALERQNAAAETR